MPGRSRTSAPERRPGSRRSGNGRAVRASDQPSLPSWSRKPRPERNDRRRAVITPGRRAGQAMRRARPRAALAAGGARAPLPPGETPGHSYQHPQVGAWAVSSVPFQPPCAGGDRRCWAASSLRRWPLIITHFGGPTRQAKDGSNIVGGQRHRRCHRHSMAAAFRRFDVAGRARRRPTGGHDLHRADRNPRVASRLEQGGQVRPACH